MIVNDAKWQELADALEGDRKLPKGFLRTIAMIETHGGDSKYLSKPSSAGAQGMFQFMPATAKQYNVNVHDAADSTRGAADMLADLQEKYGDHRIAAAAYNWGQGNVDKALAKAKANGQEPSVETL